MSKEQIEEMAMTPLDILANDINQHCPDLEDNYCGDTHCVACLANALYNAGYRKQSEGEWAFEVKHYFDDYSGDLHVYATAHCGKCGEKYPFNPTVAREYVDRPDNLIEYAEWNIDVEPIKAKVLQQARSNKNLYPFCPNCGAKMKGGAE